MSDELYVRKLTQKDDMSTIIMYLQGRLPGNYILSDALEKKMDAMSDCRDLIRQYGGRAKVVSMLMNMNTGMTRSTAERIYQETMFVFNTTQTTYRDFWIDLVMEQITQTKKKALVASDLKTAAACDSNMAKMVALMTDGKDAELYKMINVAKRVIVFDPEITGVTVAPDWKKEADRIIAKAKQRNLNDFPEVEFSETTKND